MQPGTRRPYCPRLRPDVAPGAPIVQPLLVAIYLDEQSRAEILQRCFPLAVLNEQGPAKPSGVATSGAQHREL